MLAALVLQIKVMQVVTVLFRQVFIQVAEAVVQEPLEIMVHQVKQVMAAQVLQ